VHAAATLWGRFETSTVPPEDRTSEQSVSADPSGATGRY
jgi:hypothetical protein